MYFLSWFSPVLHESGKTTPKMDGLDQLLIPRLKPRAKFSGVFQTYHEKTMTKPLCLY